MVSFNKLGNNWENIGYLGKFNIFTNKLKCLLALKYWNINIKKLKIIVYTK